MYKLQRIDSIRLPESKSVKSFYFLEYFYVLLKSIENYKEEDKIFDSFNLLKQKYLLKKSSSKRLANETENLSKLRGSRYRYTFEQVVEESLEYKLVKRDDEKKLSLTDEGRKVLKIYEGNGVYEFKKAIFRLMEQKSPVIRYLVEFCYKANPENNGLLIFPSYSPRKLGVEKADLKTSGDIIRYSLQLQSALQKDIRKYLRKEINLSKYHPQLIEKLQKTDQLIPKIGHEHFDPKNYKAIMKRFRLFWLNVFLKDIYHYKYSLTSFDLWAYRAKQIGLIQITEFYPQTNGRIVYPTSIILNSPTSKDFEKVYAYRDKSCVFVHRPAWEYERTQEKFVKSLTEAYLDMRKTYRNYFINLADVRELVCYSLKISELLFDEFLEKSYKLSISDQLNIKIALEVDKLPQETNALYLKRHPVMIDNKYRNIIAIDITRGA